MHQFHYVDGALHCEQVPLSSLAAEVGTPFYCYSHQTLTSHLSAFQKAFAPVDHLVCFSVKVNSNLAILSTLFGRGAGADIVSGGELYRALKAGADPKKIVYSGVGKREDEIRYALQAGILMFNVESPLEAVTINRVAEEVGEIAHISLRINPDVDPMTHPYISTGLKKNKFGIAIDRALVEYREARTLSSVRVVGVDCHIGSQITQLSPFVDALAKLKELVHTLRSEGFDIRYLDIGGGLGIPYSDETPPLPSEYGRAVIDAVGDLGCTLVTEPGRVIAGNAGVLVSRVLYTKEGEEKRFLICDAAMNDLVRPSLYGSFHDIRPLVQAPETITADLVGPICESTDFLAKDRRLADLQPGDLFAVMSAGAYGFIMGSNYNSRTRVPEVLVQGDRWWVVRKRETYEDLVRGETIPKELG
ncbi:MAG: diaminopimelate decarboxylase [Deltaproteobacteria bacterium]|nr:diaminopimelate decarboxylase [Deltaproteobacteria bacterium]